MKNLDAIIKRLTDYKNEYSAKLEVWQKVTLEKKKSGEEFEQIGRGLKGAKLSFPDYESDKMHPQIKIIFSANGRILEDHLLIYGHLDEHPEKVNDHEIRENGIYRKVFIFTPDEIREAIAKYIDFHSSQIESYERQLKAAKKAFNAYKKAIEKAEEQLRINSGCYDEKYKNSLYYAIKDQFN